jgi:hypothetical protein
MARVRMFAWVFLGALGPEDGSVKPVRPANAEEVQGSTAAVVAVDVLQKGAPEGPPSP